PAAFVKNALQAVVPVCNRQRLLIRAEIRLLQVVTAIIESPGHPVIPRSTVDRLATHSEVRFAGLIAVSIVGLHDAVIAVIDYDRLVMSAETFRSDRPSNAVIFADRMVAARQVERRFTAGPEESDLAKIAVLVIDAHLAVVSLDVPDRLTVHAPA